MSRETDSPSPTPNGPGGSSHPSEPSRPEERKTETTLTTRVKINIPGSRPIPPVVVRQPVGDGSPAQGEQPEAGGPAAQSGGSGGPSAAPGDKPSSPSSPPAPAKEKTSDWFAPRKAPTAPPQGGSESAAPGRPALPGPSAPAQGGAPGQGGAPAAGGQNRPPAAGTPAPALPQRPTAPRPGGGAPTGQRPPGAPRPSAASASNAPGAARPGGQGGTNGAGLPSATGGPVAPGHGGGTGSVDVTEALNAGPLGPRGGRTPGGDPAQGGGPLQGGGPAQGGGPLQGGGPAGQGAAPKPPTGPTGGPVTGSGPLTPNLGGGMSDDTTVLTPQRPFPGGTGAPGAPRRDTISGDTLTSGLPRVPGGSGPAGPAGGVHGGPAAPPPGRPGGPVAPTPAPVPASAAQPARKKGRNKLVLLGGGLVALCAVAYGAGLLLNHSDVPKGTTVLGVEIGGGTRDEAAQKLDQALGDRADKPLRLTVEGDTVSLEPDQAGLDLDTRATVGAAAKSDYNPVSVIGSLFGQEREIEPNMPVDSEKLRAALEEAAGGAGSVTEGGIEFKAGKAVAVHGKPGKGIDVEKALPAVKEAYRLQVAGGDAGAVELPVATREPSVPDAEVDRMMKEFARPAMSGLVTVQTDAAHTISFSPENSLWRFLRVKAVDGRLVESYDKAELEKLYGETFDGVLITRGTGKKTPVTVEDVIGALRPALVSTTERVGVIDTDPS